MLLPKSWRAAVTSAEMGFQLANTLNHAGMFAGSTKTFEMKPKKKVGIEMITSAACADRAKESDQDPEPDHREAIELIQSECEAGISQATGRAPTDGESTEDHHHHRWKSQHEAGYGAADHDRRASDRQRLEAVDDTLTHVGGDPDRDTVRAEKDRLGEKPRHQIGAIVPAGDLD